MMIILMLLVPVGSFSVPKPSMNIIIGIKRNSYGLQPFHIQHLSSLYGTSTNDDYDDDYAIIRTKENMVVDEITSVGFDAEMEAETGIIIDNEDDDKISNLNLSPIRFPDVDSSSSLLSTPSLSLSSFPPYLPILALCWTAALLSALDRIAISIALLPMSVEYGLDETVRGTISSAFSAGYALSVLPSGLILANGKAGIDDGDEFDKDGTKTNGNDNFTVMGSPRAILATGIFLWSVATILTPFAASYLLSSSPPSPDSSDIAAITNPPTVVPLLFARVVVGMAEGCLLPSIQRLVSNWVPENRKSSSLAFVISGFQIGTVLSYLAGPRIMDLAVDFRDNQFLNFDQFSLFLPGGGANDVTAVGTTDASSAMMISMLVGEGGWKSAFLLYGTMGLMFLGPWLAFAKDAPPIVVVSEGGVGSSSIIAKPVEIETKEGMDNIRFMMTDDDDDDACNSNENIEKRNNGPFRVFREAPWTEFAQSKAVWAMTIAHAANNWGMYNALSWTPTFYSERYGLDTSSSAFYSVAPSVAAATFGLIAGTFADRALGRWNDNDGDTGVKDDNIINDGGSNITVVESSNINGRNRRRTNVRRIFQSISLVGPALCLLSLSILDPSDPDVARALLTIAAGLLAFNAAGYGSAPQEKAGPRWSGLLYGVTSLPGVAFGSLGVYVTGRILDASSKSSTVPLMSSVSSSFDGDNAIKTAASGDWGTVWGLVAVVYTVGALAFVAFYDSEREFD